MNSPSPDDEITSTELAPRRLAEGGGGAHEQNLVASARLDRVPSGAKKRALAALGGVFELHNASVESPGRAALRDTVTPVSQRAALGAAGAGVAGAIVVSLWLSATPGARVNSEVPPVAQRSTSAAAEASQAARASLSPTPPSTSSAARTAVEVRASFQAAIAERPNGLGFGREVSGQTLQDPDRVVFSATAGGDLNGDGASDLLTTSLRVTPLPDGSTSLRDAQIHIHYGVPGSASEPSVH